MSRLCDICRSPDGEHVSVFDDRGASPGSACAACFDALGGEGCAVCGEPVSGKYGVGRDGRGPYGGDLCGDCRVLWLHGDGALAARVVRLGVSRFTERVGVSE
jgi:hypothetical protein